MVATSPAVRRLAAAATLTAVVNLTAAGCGDTRLGRGLQKETQVVLAITAVPTDVTCVRLSATGQGRTVTREVDVTAGAEVNEAFGGLPLGTLQFLGEAFPGACTAVTKATIPTWVSEPAEAAIVLGRIASVALTLHRNGRAKVTLDFADESACQPLGASCLATAECCSKHCIRGACTAGADAAAPVVEP
jgi:hypothetical protein